MESGEFSRDYTPRVRTVKAKFPLRRPSAILGADMRLRRVLRPDPAPPKPPQDIMNTIEFPLDREHVQLNNLLKLTGLAGSGGAGKALVAAGGITVDGAAESRKTAKIKVGQVVRCGDTEIRVVAPPAA
jgi:ribosome-associated protein